MSTNFIATPQYKCRLMNGRTAMVNVAADFYTFGTKLHKVSSVLNCVTWSLINHCLNNVIRYSLTQLEEFKWQYLNINPSAHTIKDLTKIHKPNQPIRYCKLPKCPAYKLSKLFTHKFNQLKSLPHTLNVKNAIQIIQALKQTPVFSNYKFASLNITYMYRNIPITETRKLLITSRNSIC